jgi:hypothetical protein
MLRGDVDGSKTLADSETRQACKAPPQPPLPPPDALRKSALPFQTLRNDD